MKRRLSTTLPAVLALACLISPLFATPCAANHSTRPTVERVRFSVDEDRTRVVLDLTGSCGYKVSTHKNPDRISVNIPNARAGRLLAGLVIPKGVVGKVRINRLSWGIQVVFDLESPARCEHFALGRARGKPDRIVLDVFGSSGGETRPARQSSRAVEGKPFVVAVDAGHGGKDPGTSGRYGLVEKKLVLDIAKRVAAEINKKEGYKAILIRSTDVYLTLPRRTRIADEKGADIFVSIHLNSARSRSARGAEVFFLSPAGAAATASKVLANPNRAARELGLSGSNKSDLLHMLVDVNQQTVMARSEQLAECILVALSRKDLPPTRSVKQKSFSVLRTITMPSVLIEAGFLTNAYDTKVIGSAEGRELVAQSISNGILSFYAKHPPQRSEREQVLVHKVKKGENLWKISRKYGTSVASLQRVNNLDKSSVLRVGQELLISGGY